MTRMAAVAVLLAGGVVAADQQVFRGRLDTVPVYTTVTDGDGRLVTDLTREDFEVFDNGRRQEITLFDNSPQPIRLIVMLDVSGSMSGNVRLVQLACEQLFKHLGPDDQVKIGTFGNDITIMPAFTRDVVALRSAVPKEIPDSAPTPLYLALERALSAFDDSPGRRVILVLSDGRNYAPGGRVMTVVEIIDRAQREDVMVYGIGIRGRPDMSAVGRGGFGGGGFGGGISGDPDPELPRLAGDTGGGYFKLEPREDLGAAFARVADELHRQYMIGFSAPARDGRTHRVEVKVVKEGRYKPRARKTYQAPKGGGPISAP